MHNRIIKCFTVEDARKFPIDMLRTDQCWPLSADDAARIGAHFGLSDAASARGRIVTVETIAKYAPNRQRWASFGWRVID